MPKSVVSDRKRNANQANALKSTGPNTAAGKAISRLNAITHGLTAQMVVLPTENQADFDAQRLGWIEDWKPQSQTRLDLVEHAVVLSWRLKRCVRVETGRLTKLAQAAATTFDNDLKDRLVRGLQLMVVQPMAGLEALGNDPEGIQMLIGYWKGLEQTVRETPQLWNDYTLTHARLMNLIGLHDDIPVDHVGLGAIASMRLLQANLGDLPEDDRCDKHEAAELALSLAEWFRKQANGLIAKLANYNDPAEFRRREIELNCVDISREGLALHRYEATHDRAFRATVNQLIQMAKTGSDLIEQNEATDDTNPSGITECVEDIAIPAESKPARDAQPTPVSPNEAIEEPSRIVDRDREGRVWTVEATDPVLTDQ